jgi:hypothetical protein
MAIALQPCLISPLILAYGQHVLVEGFSFKEFKHRFLPSISSLCWHTDILHIFKDQKKLQALKYIWTH